MDGTQLRLISLLETVPDCIESRQKLKSALMDFIPEKKMQINLLLNAYDEGIASQLDSSPDKTMFALKTIRNLTEGYGLTKEAANWAVITWCQILNQSEIASILSDTVSAVSSTAAIPSPNGISYKDSFDLKATYKAGTDFPAGDIKIELDGKMQKGECTVSISKSPKRLRDLEGTWFNSQVYVTVKEGEYLAVFPWNYFGWELDFSTYRIIKVN